VEGENGKVPTTIGNLEKDSAGVGKFFISKSITISSSFFSGPFLKPLSEFV